MTIPFNDYYDRLQLLCLDAISGSVVTDDPLSGAKSYPFWVINILDTPEVRRVGRNGRIYQINAELILARGGVDSGVGGKLYSDLLDDYKTVMYYFFVHCNMRREIDGIKDDEIDFFIPGSIRIRGTGTGLLQVTQATGQGLVARGLRGTRYQISWEHEIKLTEPII